MQVRTYDLWENIPGGYDIKPDITAYIPDNKKSDSAVVILPGGGYAGLCDYEGDGYARFFAENGICAFVVRYRLAPHRFPLQLLDARRAVSFVRYNADKFGIDKNKVAIMGSSAGAHLAALCSTYHAPIDLDNADEIDNEDFIPNAQILCYPVIRLYGNEFAHFGSGENLLGENLAKLGEELSPDLIANEKAPKAFIWHTMDDEIVDVRNSLYYAARLREVSVSAECHIFPNGRHGLALSGEVPHTAKWSSLLLDWLSYIGF